MNAVCERLEAFERSAVYSSSTIFLIGLCFILSGATGLIYEVLWARMLGLVFGATTLAVSTVLAAFMGGLALGSAFAGKLAQRIRKPLSTYGLMEIGIAVYALLVPFLFRWIDNLYALDLAATTTRILYVQSVALRAFRYRAACAHDIDGCDASRACRSSCSLV